MAVTEIKVGSKLVYSENGLKGLVEVLSIKLMRTKTFRGTELQLRAIEDHEIGKVFRPIKKGDEWSASKADVNGHWAGWWLYDPDSVMCKALL